jgi:hypothetical protein
LKQQRSEQVSEFTKGPWTVHKNGRIVLAGGIRIYQSTGPGGAQSVQVQQRLDAELRANANLLAAATELYEALNLLLDQSWNGPIDADHIARIRAVTALKKARGE